MSTTAAPKTASASGARTATAPKASTSAVAARANGATATASAPQSAAQATQHALVEFQQLQQTVSQLGNELNSYNDPNLIGRNPVLLRSLFDQIAARCMQIAWSYKFNWTPPQEFARNGRASK